MDVKLGAVFPTRDIAVDRHAIRDWAQATKELGFDFIEVPDHVVTAEADALPGFTPIYTIDDAFHEMFVTASYLAAFADGLEIATGVLILPQRQTALVAKQAAQLDILTGGRLRLGVGVGWNPLEYEALGEVWATRGRRQAEQVELMNRLWTERSVTFEGDFHTVTASGINPPPIQRPIPVWFGGSADAALRRAAKYGQGWIPLGGPSEERLGQLKQLRQYLRDEGRNPFQFGIEVWVRAGKGGPDDWRRAADAWAEHSITHVGFYCSGQDIGPLDKQIDAMRRFVEAMR
ncbi:MAG: LLM class F420-dependent oxidoreductase [Alphaproteobacteria bacterium]